MQLAGTVIHGLVPQNSGARPVDPIAHLFLVWLAVPDGEEHAVIPHRRRGRPSGVRRGLPALSTATRAFRTDAHPFGATVAVTLL